MFVVGKERRAWWPVTWTAAAEDGGETVENRIELRFRLLDVDALDDLQERANAASADVAPETKKSAIYARILAEVAIGWRGVGQETSDTGDEAQPLPFSLENLQLLMKEPGVWQASLDAYRDCLAGRAEIRAGN